MKEERNVSRFGIQRKIVAQMTSESWRSIPHVSYVFEPNLNVFIPKFKKFNDEIKKTANMLHSILLCTGQYAKH